MRELAKESGVPYINYTPPGAETTTQVRERAIAFFQGLCHELLSKFGVRSSISLLVKRHTLDSLRKQEFLLYCASFENLNTPPKILVNSNLKRSISTENLQARLTTNRTRPTSCKSSVDSALDMLSVSSDQQSTSSSTSLISSNSGVEKHRNVFKGLLHTPYKNHFSDVDVLVVTHGAVIRELIKYFACDLQTDIGQYLDTIQDIAPNTSITRFEVTHLSNENLNLMTTVQLVDYHNKQHLINTNNDECNLDVINKCNL